MKKICAIFILQVHGAKNGSRFCLHPLCFATPSQSCARVSSVSTLRPRCKPILSKHFRHQLIDGPGSPGGHKRPHSTWQHFNLPPLLVIDVTQQTLLDPPHTPSESSKSLQLNLLYRRGIVRLVDHDFITQCDVPQHLHQKYGRAAFGDISDNFQDVSSQKYDKMIQSVHHSQLSALKQH